MSDQDWQARAQQFSFDYALSSLEPQCADAVLTFAKEYAAEAPPKEGE